MDADVIAAQIAAELGDAPNALFTSFDPEPFAAASVGQVHRAVTDDGRQVVVKAQYPGVDEAVDSDLAQVKLALRVGGLIRVPHEMLDAMFEELRARLHEELDYCNEADNIRRFQAFHAPHPHVVVPGVVAERSSKRVLTVEYVAGRDLAQLEAPGTPQELRDRVGTHLARTLVDQIFELGWVHGDPNPANFAWRDDGTLIVYDFGCVKRLEPHILRGIREILVAARDGDAAAVDRALITLGPRRPDAEPLDEAFYGPWLDALTGPLRADGPFDFGRATLVEDVMRLVPSATRHMSRFQPAPELAILDRELVGLYDIGHNLGARVDLAGLLAPHLR